MFRYFVKSITRYGRIQVVGYITGWPQTTLDIGATCSCCRPTYTIYSGRYKCNAGFADNNTGDACNQPC